MDYRTWKPVYEAILTDFGFEKRADEQARDVLGGLCQPFDLDRFDHVSGATVAVAGAGPSLHSDLDIVRNADLVFAASTAADVIRKAGIGVDCMVTDLDKNPETVAELTGKAVPVAVHGHGDNIPAIREYIPSFDREHVLATTQAAPTPIVQNFGGFTDGDRAAFIADHFGAEELVFPGWDFDDSSVDDAKQKKLRWAERLLRWLELRREETFGILDGRRKRVDAKWTPPT